MAMGCCFSLDLFESICTVQAGKVSCETLLTRGLWYPARRVLFTPQQYGQASAQELSEPSGQEPSELEEMLSTAQNEPGPLTQSKRWLMLQRAFQEFGTGKIITPCRGLTPAGN